jgi:hypothetical protein
MTSTFKRQSTREYRVSKPRTFPGAPLRMSSRCRYKEAPAAEGKLGFQGPVHDLQVKAETVQ